MIRCNFVQSCRAPNLQLLHKYILFTKSLNDTGEDVVSSSDSSQHHPEPSSRTSELTPCSRRREPIVYFENLLGPGLESGPALWRSGGCPRAKSYRQRATRPWSASRIGFARTFSWGSRSKTGNFSGFFLTLWILNWEQSSSGPNVGSGVRILGLVRRFLVCEGVARSQRQVFRSGYNMPTER